MRVSRPGWTSDRRVRPSVRGAVLGGSAGSAGKGDTGRAKKQDGEQLLGQLPGTGGDFLDTEDVEGHSLRKDEEGNESLYRGGPTTQGEIVMRGPNDNPHGDR